LLFVCSAFTAAASLAAHFHLRQQLAGLAHAQLYRQRGTKLGPANCGRRLDAAERQAIEQKMKDERRLADRCWLTTPSPGHQPGPLLLPAARKNSRLPSPRSTA
jgi:hypothetical protein